MGRMARTTRTGRMGVTGVMAVIFVMGATTATTVITGAKGPLPTARTATSPQVGASLTVRPVPRMATARREMTATARAGGLRVRRAMTGRAAMTAMIVKIVQAVQIGPIVQTVRIGMAVRTGRTETAGAIRTVPPGVGETVARAVAPAVIKMAAVTAARINALALAAASPSGPEIPLTMPYLRQRCGF